MQYFSTRDSELRVSAQEAIVRGLAPQSGLFVPEAFPKADLEGWKNLSYPELAEKVLAGFLTDYSADFLHNATAATYGAAFDGKAGRTVKVREGLYSLELWHGPTCAFKDYALQLMPKLLVEAKKMLGRTETTRILVATSGDTGKAALAGYADLDGIEIEVFYPNDGTSEIQHLQMATQKGGNVQVYAVQGNFDDAQTGVKKVFADADVAAELEVSMDGAFVNIITVDVEEYAKTHFEKAVKKTLTIPAWLNTAALEQNINFSQVLQDALKAQLHMG